MRKFLGYGGRNSKVSDFAAATNPKFVEADAQNPITSCSKVPNADIRIGNIDSNLEANQRHNINIINQ
jgi:type IV pilus biogenesis protein CpaD/CtpE